MMAALQAAYTKRGAKSTNEDACCVLFPESSGGGREEWRVFGAAVFDGHGGNNGAIAAQEACQETRQWFREITLPGANRCACRQWTLQQWTASLETHFVRTHERIRARFYENELEAADERARAAGRAVPPHSDIEVDSDVDESSRTSPGGTCYSNSGVAPKCERPTIDDKGVVRKCTGSPVHGGTTATIVVVVQDLRSRTAHVICANVGDSNAFLFARNGADGAAAELSESDSTTSSVNPQQVRVEPRELSVDHGPDSTEEYRRVCALSEEEYPHKLQFVYDRQDVIRKYLCPRVFLPDDRGVKDDKYLQHPWRHGLRPTNARYDPAVYAVSPACVGSDTTCIAMTRALGDFYAHPFGLTCVPSVTLHTLRVVRDDPFVIALGTDGVWDCFKFDDFVRLTRQHLDEAGQCIDKATTSLVEHTQRTAVSLFGARHYDDASLALLFVTGGERTDSVRP
ncbi:MAG: hypothetical protein MHM6MM_000277 [Cercozoa sp. M6MM]